MLSSDLCFKVLSLLSREERRGNERKWRQGALLLLWTRDNMSQTRIITTGRGKDKVETGFRSRNPRAGSGADLHIFWKRRWLWCFLLKVGKFGLVGMEVEQECVWRQSSVSDTLRLWYMRPSSCQVYELGTQRTIGPNIQNRESWAILVFKALDKVTSRGSVKIDENSARNRTQSFECQF